MMKITQNGDNLHSETHAGGGFTFDEALEDALKDISPLDTIDTQYIVVIVKVIRQVEGKDYGLRKEN